MTTTQKIWKGLLWLVMLVYLAILTKMILFKKSPGFYKSYFLHRFNSSSFKRGIKAANFEPFASIKLYTNCHHCTEYVVQNIGGNIVGFIPMGILFPLLFGFLRHPLKTIIAVFLMSLVYETIQLLTDIGIFDVDDLILNTSGGTIGYLLYALYSWNSRKLS